MLKRVWAWAAASGSPLAPGTARDLKRELLGLPQQAQQAATRAHGSSRPKGGRLGLGRRLSSWRALLPRNPVTQFALSFALAVVLVGAGSVYFFRQAGADEAIRDARVVTASIAGTAIEPALRDSIVRGDPRAIAALDRVVRRYVVRGDVVRVKLWTAAGRIVYSDEKPLIGSTYRLGKDDLQTIATGRVAADISNLSAPENRYERRFGISYLPILLGALGLLAIVQLSLAWSLARRLRSGQQERERLLLRSIQASNAERRRIAADLHDTVVQDMAGVSLTLGAAAGEVQDDRVRALLQRGAASTRQSMRRLRSLLVDIYPPNLQAEGLQAALSDVLEPLSEQKVPTSLHVQESLTLPPAAEQLVFRCAQEALRNVGAHSQANSVKVNLSAAEDDQAITLTVADDGVGFTADEAAAKQAGGHLGMTLLADSAADFGARLTIDSKPGQGTRVRLEVPNE